MGFEALEKRSSGIFFKKLTETSAHPLIDQVCMRTNSDRSEEEYDWLGNPPPLVPFDGERPISRLPSYGYKIPNLDFSRGIEAKEKELRRADGQKMQQFLSAVSGLAVRAMTHETSMFADRMQTAITDLCYNDYPFFHTAHQEGGSPVQSNKITVQVVAGDDPVNPSAASWSKAFWAAITAIRGFKDDQNQPWNMDANSFACVHGAPSLPEIHEALNSKVIVGAGGGAVSNAFNHQNRFNITPHDFGRLDSTYHDGTNPVQFALLRTDGEARPFVKQIEVPISTMFYDGVFNQGVVKWAVERSYNIRYGLWSHAIHVTFAPPAA